jgi:anti-sigma B factor antagonist
MMNVRTVNDSVAVIAVQGEFSSFAESSLMDAYTRACMSPGGKAAVRSIGHIPTVIIFDFSELEYMNSSGIGLLVTFLVRANRQKQRLFAYGLSEHYQQIFAITRLNEAIRIFDTESEALQAAVSLIGTVENAL